MVSIVTGSDLGVSTNSNNGKQEGVNLTRESVSVNSTTGNLLVQGQDEVLTTLGVDIPVVRTYNSQGLISGNDIDTWGLSVNKRLLQIPSSANSSNSKILRESGDDAQSEFIYDSGRKLYVSTEGEGAHDTLSYNSGSRIWTWNNGTPGVYEEYNFQGQLVKVKDADNNTQNFSYKTINGVSVMRRISNSNGQEIRFNYADNPLSSASTPKLQEILTRIKNYVVKEGDTWNSIAQTLYGTTSAAADLKSNFNNVALKAGVELKGLGKINGARPEESRTQYGYDSRDRLVQVIVDLTPEDDVFTLQTDPNTGLYKSFNGQTYVTTYTYEGTSQRIASVTQGNGTQMSFGYDPSGRVNRITDGMGNSTTLTYDGKLGQTAITQLGSNSAKDVDALARERHQTTITEADNTVTRYLNDGHGRLRSQISYPQVGQLIAIHYAYDQDGNVVQITQADGTHINYQYNTKGNLKLQQDSEGNTLSYRYDSLGRQVAKIDYGTADALPDDSNNTAAQAAVTRYVYDGEHHLRFVISPDGQVTENQYLANGNRNFTRQFTHDQYPVGGLADSTNLSEAQLRNWVSNRNLSRVQRTDYGYDFRGQVNATTTYALVATNGNGIKDGTHSVTRFVYDAAGRLLQKVDARGTATNTVADYTTHFVYDGLGRLIQSTNAAGDVTSTVYDDENNQTTTINAAGLVTTSIYDANGQLMKTVQGSPEQWTQDFSAGITGFNGNVSSRPTYIQVVNGRLVTRTQSSSSNIWPTIYRSKINNYSDNIVFRSEVTTGSSAAGRYLLIGADNTGRSKGVPYRRHAAYFSGRNIYSNNFDVNRKRTYSTHLGKTKDNTTYIAEVETTSQGSTLYVYEKGSERSTGWQHYTAATDWQISRGRIWTLGTPGRAVSEMYIDNMSESKSLLSTTQYKYDSDGKLRYRVDPNGTKMHMLYDSADRMVATVDGNGTLNETVYNSKNQIAKTIVYGRNLSSSVLKSLVNADGSPANVGMAGLRSAAGNNNDRVQNSIYDTAGRLVFNVDADNYVTETRYNGRGQITDYISYAKTLSSALGNFPNVSDVQSRLRIDVNNDRHQRHYYDADGQLVATLDAEGYLVKFTYDQAGRQTKAYQFAEQLPNFNAARSDWTLNTIRNAIVAKQREDGNLNDNISTYTIYNAKGQVTGIIDGEGYLTETKYDTVGNAEETVRYANKAKPYFSTATVNDLIRTAAQPKDKTSQPIANQRTQSHFNELNQVEWTRDTQNTITTYVYDANGKVVSQSRYAAQAGSQNATATVDLRTQTTQYNAQGQLIAELNGEGSKELSKTVTQSQIDRVWQQYASHYSYDSAGRLRLSRDQWGNNTSFYYNSDNQLVYTISSNGEVQRTEYNVFGEVSKTIKYSRRISETGTGTNIYQLANLGGGQVSSLVENLVEKITYTSRDESMRQEYTHRGQLKTAIDGENFRSEYQYNAYGELSNQRVQTSTIPANTRSLLTNNRPNSFLSRNDRFIYDRRGLLTDTFKDSDPLGLTIHPYTQYDAFGRATHITDGNRETSQNVYDKIGRIVQTIDPGLKSRYVTYDAHSRVLEERDALLNATRYHYDENEKSVSIITPEGLKTKTIQNEHGETLTVTDGSGVTNKYVYDKSGNVKSVIEALGTQQQRTTTNNYSNTIKGEFGRLYETIDADGNKIRFEYDAGNRVLKRTVDPGKQNIVTQYSYDGIGRTVKTWEGISSVNPRLTQQYYNNNGQLTHRVVDTGNTTTNITTRFYYNGLGEVTSTDLIYKNTVQKLTTYTYDAHGRRETETIDIASGSAEDITTRYMYDNNDNVILSVDGNGNETHYVYNNRNERVYTINPLGEVSKNIYNANGQVSDYIIYHQNINLSANTYQFKPSYVDSLVQTNLNNTSYTDIKFRQEHYEYNNDGQKISTTVSEGQYKASPLAGDGKHIVSEYIYDKAGNIIFETVLSNINDPENSASNREIYHVYDALNREVFTINGLGYSTETRYDKVNNVVETIQYAAPTEITTLKATLKNPAKTAQQRINAVRSDLDLPYIVDGSDLNNKNQKTQNFYNDANQLVYTIDAEGSVSKNIYGHFNSELITQIRYDGQLNGGLINGEKPTITTLNNLTSPDQSKQNQNTHYVYDKTGRQTYSIQVFTDAKTSQSLAYVTKSSYNGSNKVTETIQYYDAINASSLVSSVQLRETNIVSLLDARTDTTSSKDLIIQFQYDRNDRLIHKITAVGTTDQYQEDYYYDKNGNLLATTNGNGDTTYSQFNAADRQIRSINAEGFMVDYEHDVYGNIIEQYTYMNKLTKLPETIDTNFISFNKTNTTAASNAGFAQNNDIKLGDRHESYRYDVFGNQIAYLSPTINTAEKAYQRVNTVYTYDNFGNLISTTQAEGLFEQRVIDRRYNILNQVTKEYKGRKASLTINDAQYNVAYTEYRYDAFGNQVVIIDPRAEEAIRGVTTWAKEYRALAKTTNATLLRAQFTTEQEFDRLNRKTAAVLSDSNFVKSNQDTGRVTTTYDAFGNINTETDARGKTKYFVYDNLNRVRMIQDREGAVIELQRDVHGNVVREIRYADKHGGNISNTTSLNAAPDIEALDNNLIPSGRIGISTSSAVGPFPYFDSNVGRIAHFFNGTNLVRLNVDNVINMFNRDDLISVDITGNFDVKKIYYNNNTIGGVANIVDETITFNHSISSKNLPSSNNRYEWNNWSSNWSFNWVKPDTYKLLDKTINATITVNYLERGIEKTYTFTVANSAETSGVPPEINRFGEIHKEDGFYNRINISNSILYKADNTTQPADADLVQVQVAYKNNNNITKNYVNQYRYSEIQEGFNIDIRVLNGEYVKSIDSINYGLVKEKAQVITSEFNALSQNVATIDALGNIEKYRYDSLGNTTQYTDKNGNSINFRYDALGNKVEERLPTEKKNLLFSTSLLPAHTVAFETGLENSYLKGSELISLPNGKTFYVRGGVFWEYDTQRNKVTSPVAVRIQPNAKGYAATEDGNLIVAHVEANNRVKYAIYDDKKGWQTAQTFLPLQVVDKVALTTLPGGISIMMVSVNSALYAYQYDWDSNNWLYVDRHDTATVSTSQIDIKVGLDGNVFISYVSSASKILNVVQFNLNKGFASADTHKVAVSGDVDIGSTKRLGIDSKGNAYLAYSKTIAGVNTLYLEQYNYAKNIWSPAQVIDQGNTYFDYKLVADKQGNVHMLASYTNSSITKSTSTYKYRLLYVAVENGAITRRINYYQRLQPDADIVVNDKGRVSYFRSDPNNRDWFLYQKDPGLYPRSLNVRWNSSSSMSNANKLVMTTDGNMVIFGDSQLVQYNSRVTNKFTFDALGNKTSVAASSAYGTRKLSYHYDKANNLLETKYPVENLGFYDRKNASKKLSQLTVPVETNTYNALGNQVTQTSRNGFITRNEFDIDNQMIRSKDAAGFLHEFSYDSAGNVFIQKNYEKPYSNTNQIITGTSWLNKGYRYLPPAAQKFSRQQQIYDGRNQLVANGSADNASVFVRGSDDYVTSSLKPTTRYIYDGNGNLVELISPNGNVSVHDYDANNQKLASIDGLGYLQTWEYDSYGNNELHTQFANTVYEPNTPSKNRVTEYRYDGLNRNIETRLKDLTFAETAYNKSAYKTGDAVSQIFYDAQGNIIRSIDAEGNDVLNKYDERNKLIESQQPLLHVISAPFTVGPKYTRPTTLYQYNGFGELIQETRGYYEDGQFNISEYTPHGGTKSVQAIRKLSYNDSGWLKEESDSEGKYINYGYDLAGNVVNQTQYLGPYKFSSSSVTTLLYYDGLNREVLRTDPFLKSDLYPSAFNYMKYDGNGKIALKGKFDSRNFTNFTNPSRWNKPYDYNYFNRSNFYDSTRLYSNLDSKSQEQFVYDKLGNLVKTNSGDGNARFYFYDAEGNSVKEVSSFVKDISNYSVSSVQSQLANTTLKKDFVVKTSFYDARGQVQELREQPQNLIAGSTVGAANGSTEDFGRAYEMGKVYLSDKKKLTVTEYWKENKDWRFRWKGKNYHWRAALSTPDMTEFTGLFGHIVTTKGTKELGSPSQYGETIVTGEKHITSFQVKRVDQLVSSPDDPIIASLSAIRSTTITDDHNTARTRRWGRTVREFEIPSYVHIKKQPTGIGNNFELYYRIKPDNYTLEAKEVREADFTLATKTINFDSGYYFWNWQAEAGTQGIGNQSIEFYYAVKDASENNISVGRGLIRSNKEMVHLPLIYETAPVDIIDAIKSSQEMLNEGSLDVRQFQKYNAFGEVIEEIKRGTDTSNKGTYITELKYNKLGKLVEKIEPNVDITHVNGLVSNLKPTTQFHYDKLGRLVETIDANNTIKSVNNRASTRQVYDGHYLVAQYQPEDGRKRFFYDEVGNRVRMTDYIGYNPSFNKYGNNGSHRQYVYDYDTQGRVVAIHHPGSSTAKPIVERFKYDRVGNQIQHSNVFGISSYVNYDAENRVSRFTDFEGNVVDHEYEFVTNVNEYIFKDENGSTTDENGILQVRSLPGKTPESGYRETTKKYYDTSGTSESLWKFHSDFTESNYYGRQRIHVDYGNRRYQYIYDWAGRLKYQIGDTNSSGLEKTNLSRYRKAAPNQLVYNIRSTEFDINSDVEFETLVNAHADAPATSRSLDQFIKYDYYDNNLVRKITDYNKANEGGQRRIGFTEYQYDDFGQVIHEEFGEQFANDLTEWESLQSATMSYDAAGRVTKINDEYRFSIEYEYDAVGNRRRVYANYKDGYKGVTTSAGDPGLREQDFWYIYDDRNRFTTTMGSLIDENGIKATAASINAQRELHSNRRFMTNSFNIQRGDGYDIQYNRVSERESIKYDSTSGQLLTEKYYYDIRGHLEWVTLNEGAGEAPAAYRKNDKAGRVKFYKEYRTAAPNGDLSQWHSTTIKGVNYVNTSVHAYEYDNNNQKIKDTDYTFSRNYKIVQNSDEDGGATSYAENLNILNTSNFSYDEIGNLIYSANQRTTNGKTQAAQYTHYTYELWDDYKKSAIKVNGFDNQVHDNDAWAPGYANFSYNSSGQIYKVEDTGKHRRLEYNTNQAGQIVRRTETNNDKTFTSKFNQFRYYYMKGKMVGEINDQHEKKTDYAAILADLDGSGQVDDDDLVLSAGREDDQELRLQPIAGRISPLSSADFDQNYQPISPSFPALTPTTYTLTGAESNWEAVASAVWGDESLWYLLAEANINIPEAKLSTADLRITVPNVITNIHNNADTFRPYNAGEAMGNTSPNLPDPPPPPGPDKCKQAVIIIVVIVVTIYTAGAASAAMGAAGSAAAGGAAVAGGTAAAGTAAAATAAAASTSLATSIAVGAVSGAAAGAAGALAGQITGNLINAQGYDGIDFGAVVEGAVIGAFAGGASGWASAAAKGAQMGAQFTQAASGAANVVTREAFNYAQNRNKENYNGFDWGSLAAAVALPYIAPHLPGNIKADSYSMDGFTNELSQNIVKGAITELVRETVWDDYKPNWDMVAVDALASAAGTAIGDYASEQAGHNDRQKAQQRQKEIAQKLGAVARAIQNDQPFYVDNEGNVVENSVMKRPSELIGEKLAEFRNEALISKNRKSAEGILASTGSEVTSDALSPNEEAFRVATNSNNDNSFNPFTGLFNAAERGSIAIQQLAYDVTHMDADEFGELFHQMLSNTNKQIRLFQDQLLFNASDGYFGDNQLQENVNNFYGRVGDAIQSGNEDAFGKEVSFLFEALYSAGLASGTKLIPRRDRTGEFDNQSTPSLDDIDQSRVNDSDLPPELPPGAPNILNKLNRSPVDQNSLIVDNNIAVAIQKQKLGSQLQPGEQQSLQKLQDLGRTDIRLTDTVAQELGDVSHLNKGINVTANRNSSEFKSLLSELENVKPSPVGRTKGTNDRQIVADAFFAEGTKPTFITADKGIVNPLLQLSGINPAKIGKPAAQAFPNGFPVTINGRTLNVIPVSGK